MNTRTTHLLSPGPLDRSAHAAPVGVEGAAFRSMMAQFPTGVVIVSTGGHGPDQGMTANAIMSVSLDPPLIAISLTRGTRTERAISESGGFTLTVLGRHQADLAMSFARPAHDHFEDRPVLRSERGHPYFPDGLGFVECVVEQTVEAGDHRIIIGLVTEAIVQGGEPLVFHSSRFGALALDPTTHHEEQQ